MKIGQVQESFKGHVEAVEVDGRWHRLPENLRVTQGQLAQMGLEDDGAGGIRVLGAIPAEAPEAPEPVLEEKVASWDPKRTGPKPQVGEAP